MLTKRLTIETVNLDDEREMDEFDRQVIAAGMERVRSEIEELQHKGLLDEQGNLTPKSRPVSLSRLLASEAKRKGKGLPVIDGLLAATALHHNLTVVSRNADDFAVAQVQVLNPWEA